MIQSCFIPCSLLFFFTFLLYLPSSWQLHSDESPIDLSLQSEYQDLSSLPQPRNVYASMAFYPKDWKNCLVLGLQLRNSGNVLPLVCVSATLPPHEFQRKAISLLNVHFRLLPSNLFPGLTELTTDPTSPRAARIQRPVFYSFYEYDTIIQLDTDYVPVGIMDHLVNAVNETVSIAFTPDWSSGQINSCQYVGVNPNGGFVVYKPSPKLWGFFKSFIEKILALPKESRDLIIETGLDGLSDQAIFIHMVQSEEARNLLLNGKPPVWLPIYFNFPIGVCRCPEHQDKLHRVVGWHFLGVPKPWVRMSNPLPWKRECDDDVRDIWWNNLRTIRQLFAPEVLE